MPQYLPKHVTTMPKKNTKRNENRMWFRMYYWLKNEGLIKSQPFPSHAKIFKKYIEIFPHLEKSKPRNIEIIENEIKNNPESPLYHTNKIAGKKKVIKGDRLHPKKKLQKVLNPDGVKTTHKERYNNYLKSTLWRNFRNKIKRKRGNKCEICGISGNETQLHGHHLNYDRLFNELETDIQILCETCHDKQHE